MRAAAAAGLVLALAAPARAGSSLGRLADALAQEIARQARGSAVQLSPTADHTGRGASLALDFDELLKQRVRAAGPSEEGPRLQVLPALAEAPGRLIASARLVRQPEGALHDIVSVSVEADTAVLALAARPPEAAAGQVDLLGSSRSAPLDIRVLDLAFMGPERLVVLGDDALALYRFAGSTLTLGSRQPLPGPLEAVRSPGGLLRAVERERSVWAAVSRASGAFLFAVEDAALVQRQHAEAVPWPGSRGGVRFRAGTDLLEGDIEGLGGGPFLDLDETGLAVDGEGRLLGAGEAASDLRVGPTLAPLWPRHLAVSTAAPPGAADGVLILSLAPPVAPRTIGELPVQGSVRALAAHTRGHEARVVAAVEAASAGGEPLTHLVVFDLALPSARP